MVDKLRGLGFAFIAFTLLYMGIVNGVVERRIPLSGRFGDRVVEGGQALALGLVFVALAPFAMYFAYRKIRGS